MHYFSNKFTKSPSALRPHYPLIFGFGDLKLRDVAKLCFFQADYDEIKLQKISYDVIKFFHFGPPPPNQNFWLRQCLVKAIALSCVQFT